MTAVAAAETNRPDIKATVPCLWPKQSAGRKFHDVDAVGSGSLDRRRPDQRTLTCARGTRRSRHLAPPPHHLDVVRSAGRDRSGARNRSKSLPDMDGPICCSFPQPHLTTSPTCSVTGQSFCSRVSATPSLQSRRGCLHFQTLEAWSATSWDHNGTRQRRLTDLSTRRPPVTTTRTLMVSPLAASPA